MRSIQQIIENQNEFKENIFKFLYEEYKILKKTLSDISTEDEYIIKEKKKLVKMCKKVNYKKYVERLFFLHSRRNRLFYVWWDENENEAKIYKYEQG